MKIWINHPSVSIREKKRELLLPYQVPEDSGEQECDVDTDRDHL